jgi:hypothetical protein
MAMKRWLPENTAKLSISFPKTPPLHILSSSSRVFVFKLASVVIQLTSKGKGELIFTTVTFLRNIDIRRVTLCMKEGKVSLLLMTPAVVTCFFVYLLKFSSFKNPSNHFVPVFYVLLRNSLIT